MSNNCSTKVLCMVAFHVIKKKWHYNAFAQKDNRLNVENFTYLLPTILKTFKRTIKMIKMRFLSKCSLIDSNQLDFRIGLCTEDVLLSLTFAIFNELNVSISLKSHSSVFNTKLPYFQVLLCPKSSPKGLF